MFLLFFYDLKTIKCKIKMKHKHVAIVKMFVFNDDDAKYKSKKKKTNGNKKEIFSVKSSRMEHNKYQCGYILYCVDYICVHICMYNVVCVFCGARSSSARCADVVWMSRSQLFNWNRFVYGKKLNVSDIRRCCYIVCAAFFLYSTTKSEWNRNHYKHE